MRDPVRREGVVANLTRAGGAGEVAETGGEYVVRGSFENGNGVVVAEGRDPDDRGRRALVDRDRQPTFLPARAQLVVDGRLSSFGDPVGAEELPADVPQHRQADDDEHQPGPQQRALGSRTAGHPLSLSPREGGSDSTSPGRQDS